MKRLLIFLSLFVCAYLNVAAQNKQAVSGTVRDAENNPLPGITVLEKGTNNGAVSNGAGKFTLQVSPNAVLVLSGIGFTTQEIAVAGQTAIDARMAVDNKNLGEVVVTALGIKREKKSLGYALQEVGGDALTNSRETNVTNALTGKVAGLQIVRSSNGPAGSSKIVLRGFNSLTGSNQPLIVVDGMPLDNFIGDPGKNADYYNPGRDMGNGLADINPDDIESMSVLKGAAAAALYGSRAGNGAILITTKSGKKQKGLGLTYSTQLGFSEIFTHPEVQRSFSQGDRGVFNPQTEPSWGAEITGQTVTDWEGKQVQLAGYDNMSNYMRKGANIKNTLSFSQQVTDATAVYSSITRMTDKGIIPGADLTRTNLTARALSHFGAGNRWTIDTKVQYINSDAQNRPQNGYNDSNPFNTMYMMPVNLNIRDFSAAKRPDGKMLWWGNGTELNPYWAALYDLNNDVRNRFLMSGAIKYDFTSWLNAEIRGGADIYSTDFEAKRYAGSPSPANGSYSRSKETFTEANYSALISAHKDNLFGKLGGSASIGGNLMKQSRNRLENGVGELQIPDFFSVNNGKSAATIREVAIEKRINSVYGTLGVNWDAYWFVDATFRNDWSSALSADNRSFFYPSVSTSLVVTEMLQRLGNDLPSWLTYGKVRASYAQVGNDMEPYQLYNTFDVTKDPNGHLVIKNKNTLYDPNVRSELIKSTELGAEVRLFNNRLGADVAVYKSNATNQIIDLPMDPLSGYIYRKVNAGDIENKGIEVMLNGRILDNVAGGLNWDMTVNYSSNKNKVNYITDDVDVYPLGGYDAVQIRANAGETYGEIWGTGYQRVEDPTSPYFGKIIVNGNGLPLATSQSVRLGNQQATGLLGIGNTFSYKGVSLGFQVDARFGGKIFAGTLNSMQKSGTGAQTVVNGKRDNILVDGVFFDADKGSYQPNATSVTPQDYWAAISTGNVGIVEANLYDASNVRLRNVQLSYALPAKLLSRTPVQRATIGFSCNNVWMISSHVHGIDPESVFAAGTNAVGFENGSVPTTRSFLFNLSIGF